MSDLPADVDKDVELEAAVFVGSYQLLSLRSRQADCEVWTAVHRPTEMKVVMEIYVKTGDDKQLVESIVHRIDRFMELADCKVLRLLEAIDLEGAIFLVYEYYSSQSLQQYILNCPLNGKEFQRIVRSLIKTVQRLHKICFFHGTLSIDSFVLTRQKKLRFKDASSCHLFTKSDLEPSRFDAILSKATDIWSIGAIIYRLIACQIDSIQLPGRKSSTTAEEALMLVSEGDSDLADLLTRMTDQNPTARISTADCLRHPYLARSQAVRDPRIERILGKREPGREGARGRISQDVVRYLGRATGAPEGGIAEAVGDNDLSSWNAAYWLVKQRIAAGRGYPELSESDAADSANAAVAAVDGAASASRGSAKPAASAAATAAASAGYRRTVSQLRSRRLGLRSPEPLSRVTTGTAAAAATASRHQGMQQQQQPQPDSLPPITGRSVTGSRHSSKTFHSLPYSSRSSQQRQQKQQQQQQKQQEEATEEDQLATRRQTFATTTTTTKTTTEAAATAAAPQTSRDSSAIRVQVQLKTLGDQLQPHTQRQSTTLTVSPRQPPNSRTELAQPGQADAGSDDDGEADGDQERVQTLYRWDNAMVRRSQWLQSRAI